LPSAHLISTQKVCICGRSGLHRAGKMPSEATRVKLLRVALFS
jgi:hypothetical protein